MILGKSGVGKSTLAAEMMALGCALVCDDAVDIRLSASGEIHCHPPENASENLELRGIGLLPLPLKSEAKLLFCLELTEAFGQRFPSEEHLAFGERQVPIYRTCYAPGLAAKAVLLLRYGGVTLRA